MKILTWVIIVLFLASSSYSFLYYQSENSNLMQKYQKTETKWFKYNYHKANLESSEYKDQFISSSPQTYFCSYREGYKDFIFYSEPRTIDSDLNFYFNYSNPVTKTYKFNSNESKLFVKN